jgi:hypothetical protein
MIILASGGTSAFAFDQAPAVTDGWGVICR